MAPYKRPMLVFEGKPYRKGILSSEEPKYARSGPLDGILLNDLSLGFIVRLELPDGPVVHVVRVTYYRIVTRRSGRLLYEVFGREEERRFDGLKQPKDDQFETELRRRWKEERIASE